MLRLRMWMVFWVVGRNFMIVLNKVDFLVLFMLMRVVIVLCGMLKFVFYSVVWLLW